MNQTIEFYYFKLARMVHIYKLTVPLEILLRFALQKYSKKRQSDIIGFAGLLLYVVYICHIMACIWLKFGMFEDCHIVKEEDGKCIKSWVYNEGFNEMPISSQYIFSFYWIFEVITTVGYGDYSGKTSYE